MRPGAAACSGKPFPGVFIRIAYLPVKLRRFPAVAGHAPVHDGFSGALYHFPQISDLSLRKWILLPLGVLLVAAGLLLFRSPIPLGLPLLLRYSPRARSGGQLTYEDNFFGGFRPDLSSSQPPSRTMGRLRTCPMLIHSSATGPRWASGSRTNSTRKRKTP